MNVKIALAAVVAGIALTGCTNNPETVTETKTETVETTPQACIDALDAAEALVQGPVIEQSEDTITLVGLIPVAFEAGVNMDNAAAQGVIDTMDEVNARTEARNVEIERIISEYNAAAEECRGETDTNA